jgi:hypothetical protein
MAKELLTEKQWELFRNTQRNHFETIGKSTLVWKRYKGNLERFQEDGETTDTVQLNCLIQGNYFRVWDVNKNSQAGEVDHNSIVVLINKDYLAELGHLDAKRNFVFDTGRDKFILDGVMYQPQGDTPLSQAYDTNILQMLILTREEAETGGNKYNRDA